MRSILPLLLLLFPTAALAVEPIFEPESLARVAIEIWPDFDRPEALVLVTVALPQNTPTSLRLRLPLPREATLNAVAYSDQENLISLETYERERDEIVIISPKPGIRLEYYLPLEEIDDRRAVNFAWTAPYDVDQLDLSIQEPAFSRAFELDQPLAETVVTSDGLTTRRLPPRTLAAGETAIVTASYTLPDGRLTAPPTGGSEPAPAVLDNLRSNWPWTAAGAALLLVALFFGWQTLRDRQAQTARIRKPARQRTAACPNCGTPNKKGSNFCRSCGESLKS